MNKKNVFITVMLLVLLGFQAVSAETEAPSIIFNGIQLQDKASIQEGRVFLPVRAIGEASGYQVSWEQDNRIVWMNSGDKNLSLKLNHQAILADDHEYYFSYSPVNLENRTYMRDDFYQENLGMRVVWDKEANLVRLTDMKENRIEINTVHIDAETKALSTQVQYPVIGGLSDATVQGNINALFKRHAENALQEGNKNVLELAPYLVEFPDMPGQCHVFVDYQIKYNQKDILSLVLQNYQYAGGAHGSTVQTSYTINVKTGQTYRLQDLFLEEADYLSVFNESVRKQLDQQELTPALFQPFAGIGENQNYFLTDTGIVVYFQQYELLPYAAGILEVSVDYSVLSKLLK